MSKKEWFASWFDTSYYHLLYRNRDLSEAHDFIVNLVRHLSLAKGSKVLDLACGKGRHSITLNELGMDVLGVDLSSQSIEHAQQFSNEQLHFQVQDMRFPLPNKRFDAIFNLFTSFGYFDDDAENQSVFKSVNSMLVNNGLFVFDYLNSEFTIENLVPFESKQMDDVLFSIEKSFDGKHIRKKIKVEDGDEILHFEEKVRAYSADEFENMLVDEKFSIVERFGDFQLNPFDSKRSKRLILVCKKEN